MSRRAIATDRAPGAIGTYSQAVEVDGTVYLSGQIPLENLRAVAVAAGGDLDRIVKLTVYLVDLGDFAVVNDVMARLFAEPYPARAAIQVSALPKSARVEVDAVLRL